PKSRLPTQIVPSAPLVNGLPAIATPPFVIVNVAFARPAFPDFVVSLVILIAPCNTLFVYMQVTTPPAWTVMLAFFGTVPSCDPLEPTPVAAHDNASTPHPRAS